MAFEFVKNVTGILAQPQDKINRQFLKRIEALEKKGGDDKDISDLVTAVESLRTLVGDSNGGLVKDINDLKTAVGGRDSGLVQKVNSIDAQVSIIDDIVGRTDTDPLTVLGQLKTIFLDIGNDTVQGTIKGRIKALEEANQ